MDILNIYDLSFLWALQLLFSMATEFHDNIIVALSGDLKYESTVNVELVYDNNNNYYLVHNTYANNHV